MGTETAAGGAEPPSRPAPPPPPAPAPPRWAPAPARGQEAPRLHPRPHPRPHPICIPIPVSICICGHIPICIPVPISVPVLTPDSIPIRIPIPSQFLSSPTQSPSPARPVLLQAHHPITTLPSSLGSTKGLISSTTSPQGRGLQGGINMPNTPLHQPGAACSGHTRQGTQLPPSPTPNSRSRWPPGLCCCCLSAWGELPVPRMPAEPGAEEWWTCSLESPN